MENRHHTVVWVTRRIKAQFIEFPRYARTSRRSGYSILCRVWQRHIYISSRNGRSKPTQIHKHAARARNRRLCHCNTSQVRCDGALLGIK